MAEPENGTPSTSVRDPGADAPTGPGDRPDLDFEILSAQPLQRAAAPTLSFGARVTDRSAIAVYTIALTVLFTIEPGKRSYAEADRERLVELFGEPERWASTTGSFRWAQVDVLVPSFTGSTEFAIKLPCTYDHEIAATKYFGGLEDGQAPLQLHFNGTVFYQGENGKLQLTLLPWDLSVRYELPVETWRGMIAGHYPEGDWIRLSPGTRERLGRHKASTGSATFDGAVAGMLDGLDEHEGPEPDGEPGGAGNA